MIYTFVTVFFIAVLSDTLQVRGLLQTGIFKTIFFK